MTTHRRRAGLIGLLMGLIVVLGLVPVPPARAQVTSDEVAVTLTTISPTVLGASGNLVITGTLTNRSPEALQGVEVRLWRDATPIVTLAGLESASGNPEPSGAVLQSASAHQLIRDGEPLQPGGTAEFSVAAAFGPQVSEQTWLSQPDAAYLVGVEVYGWSSGDGYRLLGRAISPIAYPGTATVNTATIVVLNARPSLLSLAAGADQLPIFADDSLVAELSGRLNTLLTLGAQQGVLSVIDPLLYDEVRALAGGYRVQQADGSVVDGSAAGAATASAWLARVDQLARTGRLARTITGSVDLLAVAEVGRPDIAQRAQDSLAAEHPLAGLPLVVVPADGQVDAASVAMMADLKPWLALASNLDGDAMVQTQDGVRLLRVAGIAAPAADSVVQQRGLLLSAQLVAAQENLVLVSVVDSVAQATIESETEPWRTRQSIPALLGAHPQPGPLQLGDVTQLPASDELLQATDDAFALIDAWDELLAADAEATKSSRAVVTTAWSTRFGRDTRAQTDWLTCLTAPAAQLLASGVLELRVSEWVTTSSDNQLPVTVVNHGNRAVQVRVHFDSENPLRIAVDDSELFTVRPGDSTTVRVQPHTYGNGRVEVQAQLVTPSGHPIGSPTSFIVTGTEAGRVSWLIIVASGLVLLAATAMRIRQVRREHRDG